VSQAGDEIRLCAGAIEVILQDGSSKKIGITRAHVEEDAGELQPCHWLTSALLVAGHHMQCVYCGQSGLRKA